jgi:Family of unknown function (DUF6308)
VTPAVLENDQRSIELLRSYFGLDGRPPYTGAFFERLGGGGDRTAVADRFTAEDLVAVSMLSVTVPARAAWELLAGEESGSLLSKIPIDVDLVDAPDALIDATSPAVRLFRYLTFFEHLGWVTAGKLMARKRPRLIPVYDTYVQHAVHGGARWWRPLRDHLLHPQDRRLHRRLLQLRDASGIGSDITPLRVFDVIVWRDEEDRRSTRIP